jgi:diguanylate cyclase (GGDEF)-like protein
MSGGKDNTWKSLSFHGLVGSLAGYFLLHPASVLIHQSFEDHIVGVEVLLKASFSSVHLPMALYFTLIGAVVGVAYGMHYVRISRLYEEVRKLSITDPLTSLYSRRYLMERLESEVDRCSRYGRSLSLIMADIDHFKKYNDTQGHQRGDELLRAAADRFRGLVRKPDFIARYGGEEFIVVMPETGCREAFHLAERMREAVSSLGDGGGGSQPGGKVTVSLGIAEMPIHAKDAATLVREADRALYRAKEEGRNRVVKCTKDEP